MPDCNLMNFTLYTSHIMIYRFLLHTDAVKNEDLAKQLEEAKQESAEFRQESAKLRQQLEKSHEEVKEIITR